MNDCTLRPEILLAEDERSIRTALTATLEAGGYDVRAARDGSEALSRYAEKRPDLLLLDVMMPKMDGLSLCRRIRESDVSTPVVFLTQLDSDLDEIRGLESGADMYIPKTASGEILLGRIAAVIRRHRHDEPAGDFSIGDWRVLPLKSSMTGKNGIRRQLNERELALLRLFAMHPGEILSRDFLCTRLWNGRERLSENALTVAVARLRDKLGESGACVKSVRNGGYTFRSV